jgi:hypothetical protein
MMFFKEKHHLKCELIFNIKKSENESIEYHLIYSISFIKYHLIIIK